MDTYSATGSQSYQALLGTNLWGSKTVPQTPLFSSINKSFEIQKCTQIFDSWESPFFVEIGLDII